MTSSILSACGSGSGSHSKSSVAPPSVSSPAQDLSALPSTVVLSNDLCVQAANGSIDGAYIKAQYIKGPNGEFDTLLHFYSKSTCLDEDMTMTQAYLNDVVSSEKVNNDFILTLSYFDVQYNIFSPEVLTEYNNAGLFETVWVLDQLESVIDKKALPTDGGPAYPRGLQSTVPVRVHVPEKTVFIQNIKFTWQ